jgi:hypothetical protein
MIPDQKPPASAGRRVRLLMGAALAAAMLGACDEKSERPAFGPTEPRLLSTDSPTKDEDPSVLLARDGRLYVAWFSDRGGNPDIFLTRTDNDTSWIDPIRITSQPGGDFYPNLLQDETGLFHLVWFRWEAFYRGHIWYNSSPDGIAWDTTAEVAVTTVPDVDDWVPTITRRTDGTLLVYFVSRERDPLNPTNQLYVSTRPPGQSLWTAAVRVSINSDTLHDHLPFASFIDDSVRLVWVRNDTTRANPWEGPTPLSNLFYASSVDGMNWSGAIRVTNDTGRVANVFPFLYPAHEDSWRLAWLSTRSGVAEVVELPFAYAHVFPNAPAVVAELPPGYSHRIAATPTPGVYLGVWVQGPEGQQDVYYRFFER